MAKETKKRKPIKVCVGSCCKEHKGKKIATLFEEALETSDAKDKLCIKKCDCTGKCKRGPVVLFPSGDLAFEEVKPKDAEKILKKIIAAL